MRDYALTLSQPSLSIALFPVLSRYITNFRTRKTLKSYLAQRDDELLDFGLTRTDLSKLLALPRSADLALEIERIQFLAARKPHYQAQ
jgi:hypothetical protein